MISFSTKILKFGNKGEKSGWSYLEVSRKHAEQLNPGCRVSFRVTGQLDSHPIRKAALLPMGEGTFILPFNAAYRKATRKGVGDSISVQLERDDTPLELSQDFIECLRDDAAAYEFFHTLPPSHQRYFSKWIEDAKTVTTKTKRIALALVALASGQGFGEMIRANKKTQTSRR